MQISVNAIEILDKRVRVCYNKSMKRIDVLKGIEQVLVQKAYETGHISHRTDGDWQKQADGSWKPYTEQSNQSVPQTQKPAENTEYGEIVKQDFESVPNSIKDKMFTIAQQYKAEWAEDSDEDIRSMAEDDVEAISQMLWDTADEETRNFWIGSENSNITNNEEEDSNDWEEEDTEGYYGNSGGLRSTIYEGAYDTQISNIGNTEEDDYGNSAPNDEAVENVVRGIMQEWTGDTDDEDAVEAVHDGLKDAVLDRWSSIYVQKSAVRDMRSTLAIKNMGF